MPGTLPPETCCLRSSSRYPVSRRPLLRMCFPTLIHGRSFSGYAHAVLQRPGSMLWVALYVLRLAEQKTRADDFCHEVKTKAGNDSISDEGGKKQRFAS